MMQAIFNDQLLSFFVEMAKIAGVYGTAKLIFLFYAYKKKWIVFSR